MNSLAELIKDTHAKKPDETRVEAENLAEKIRHAQWLRSHDTQALLKFLESLRDSNVLAIQNLADNGESKTLAMLAKETQTLTKVINYARRKQYTTESATEQHSVIRADVTESDII